MRRRGAGWVVLLALMLGVVTTYLVAWWAANRVAWRDPGMGPIDIMSPMGTGWFAVGVEEHFGATCFGSLMLEPSGRGVQSGADPPTVPPRWSVVMRGSPAEVIGSGAPRVGSLLERASGWPTRAVVERTRSPGFGPAPVAGCDLTVRVGRHADPLKDVMLAFMPMWPGFAVDVGVYGVVWVGVLVVMLAGVRGRRVRAGVCPECRYDLRGLVGDVCPECGGRVRS